MTDTLKLDSLNISAPRLQDDGLQTPHAEKEEAKCPATGAVASDTATCPVTGASLPEDPTAQEIDPELLRTSINARMAYLKDFLGFGKPQQDILNKTSPLIYGSIPEVVDGLYSKLFEFDVTKQIFMERNEGFDGPLPAKLEDLTLDSPQLIYRKIFMKAWARRIITADYSSPKTWAYLDKVGIMHTGVKSFKHRAHAPPLIVPYRDCALALGWVCDVLQTAILQLPDDKLSMQEKINAISAITKVIWIQNDLFARHYINE
ncbi:Protoglobin-domain-containing protein [Armillaria nabsnona]|nr:Protoglobin-domain-containing protein [Armillaria nabsnona]